MTSAPDSAPGLDGDEPTDEMQRLLADAERFASTMHRELEDLSTSRDRVVAAAQREAQEFIEEATQEAESILARAEQRAQATMKQARDGASEITRAVREHTERLVDTKARYRAALETALQGVDDLPDIPAPPLVQPEPEPVYDHKTAPSEPDAEDLASPASTAAPTPEEDAPESHVKEPGGVDADPEWLRSTSRTPHRSHSARRDGD